MNRMSFVRRTMPLAVATLVLGAAGADAEDRRPEGSGIVAPSEYVEDIETPGDEGGVMDEVDAGEAQAEAAAKAQKEAAQKAQKAAEEDGGW